MADQADPPATDLNDPPALLLKPELAVILAGMENGSKSSNDAAAFWKSVNSQVYKTMIKPLRAALYKDPNHCTTFNQLANLQSYLEPLKDGLDTTRAALSEAAEKQAALLSAISVTASITKSLFEDGRVLLARHYDNLLFAQENEGIRLNKGNTREFSDMSDLKDLSVAQQEMARFFGFGLPEDTWREPLGGEYVSSLPDGTALLSRGRVVTPHYRVLRPDGSSVLASSGIMNRLWNHRNAVDFELPPHCDPIYHPILRAKAEDAFSCEICLDELPRSTFAYFGCRCLICKPCLNEALRNSFSCRSLYPAKCSCEEEIDASIVEGVLNPDVLELRDKAPEFWTSSNPTYCANQGCGDFIPGARFKDQDDPKMQFGTCPACDAATCWSCKQSEASHRGLCGKCPKVVISEELLQAIKEYALTMCPTCNTLCELEEGCKNVE
jgi:hypothetical protein